MGTTRMSVLNRMVVPPAVSCGRSSLNMPKRTSWCVPLAAAPAATRAPCFGPCLEPRGAGAKLPMPPSLCPSLYASDSLWHHAATYAMVWVSVVC
jgi:hypothetical protein